MHNNNIHAHKNTNSACFDLRQMQCDRRLSFFPAEWGGGWSEEWGFSNAGKMTLKLTLVLLLESIYHKLYTHFAVYCVHKYTSF